MSLLDKVKAQAQTASAVAKDAAQKGQVKIDEMQQKRTADALLRDLGAAVYAQRTGRETPTTGDDIERVANALGQHEKDHGEISLDLESPAVAPPS